MAEDDRRLASLLAQSLTEAGWEVDLAHDGEQACRTAVSAAPGHRHDVLVLDWMLPGVEGIEVCRRLRAQGVITPVLMLTARSGVRDRIAGLDAGADDYLSKPFDLDELLARLRALYRRGSSEADSLVDIGGLVVDPRARRVSRDGVPIELSAREFDILYLLASRVDRVVTRYDILEEVWDGETDLRSNVIDVHLASIRSKVDRPFGTQTITTLRGAGYRIDRPVSARTA